MPGGANGIGGLAKAGGPAVNMKHSYTVSDNRFRSRCLGQKTTRTGRHHSHSASSWHPATGPSWQLEYTWAKGGGGKSEMVFLRSWELERKVARTAFFLSSSGTGGGPSTERDTTVSPRRITSPKDLFISCSGPASVSPCFFFGLTRRNSSQSARTRFMCLSKASIWPMKARPSLIVTFSLQLMRPSIFPPFDFGGGYRKQQSE